LPSSRVTPVRSAPASISSRAVRIRLPDGARPAVRYRPPVRAPAGGERPAVGVDRVGATCRERGLLLVAQLAAAQRATTAAIRCGLLRPQRREHAHTHNIERMVPPGQPGSPRAGGVPTLPPHVTT
jgi:hypothetical protein